MKIMNIFCKGPVFMKMIDTRIFIGEEQIIQIQQTNGQLS